MRNILDVISDIESVIPEYEYTQGHFDNIKIEANYYSSEIQPILFSKLRDILLDFVKGIPKEDWEYRVWSIFSDVPEEIIRKDVEKLFNM